MTLSWKIFVVYFIFNRKYLLIKIFHIVRLTTLDVHLSVVAPSLLFPDYLTIEWCRMVFWMVGLLLMYMYVYLLNRKQPRCEKIFCLIYFKRNDFVMKNLPFIYFCFDFHLELTWPHHVLHLLYRGNQRQSIKSL